MAMAASRPLVLPTCRLSEVHRLVNYTTVAPHRVLLTGAFHWRNRNLTEPNTFLNGFFVECTTRRDGAGGALGWTRVDARWAEESGGSRSARRDGAGGTFGYTCVDGRWEWGSWFQTCSSTRGRGAVFDVTSARVKCGDDVRRFGNHFFSDRRRTYCTMDGLGGIPSHAGTKLRWKDAGFVRSFHRTCSTEGCTSRRSRNLEIYGQNNATNERVLNEIIRIFQEEKNLEVVKLGENCHVRLVVRKPGSDLFLGISGKAAKVIDVYGRYRFSQCRKDRNILNLCASLPSPIDNSFRWWLIPGEQLIHLQSDRVNILPEGKWSRFEIPQDQLSNAILEELNRRLAYQVPLSEWRIPKSLTHQKELEYFSQMTRKVWAPLGCDVTNPLIGHSSIDAIIDSVCVQIKTSYEHKSSRGLRINIRKQGGRDECGKRTIQPYTIDDGIDAIMVNVQQNGTLIGLFVFPRKEIIARGWFRGSYHPGKVTAHVFPPKLSPRKGHESIQQWQLNYYLDVSEEVDLNRARMLLDQCNSETRENE
eukprot:GEMP01018027.1.p1 GENE.GEMP01018027.1~~GEMP01018027.1.p1  ORF type:complete len:533 (-),score=49.73 GEMP01018027.1:357-1955(-)